MSCCGEADAFEADSFELEDKHYVAIISDGKGVIPNGTTQDEVGRQLSTATGSSSSAPKANLLLLRRCGRRVMKQRCAHCGGRFGLIRHRWFLLGRSDVRKNVADLR